MAMILYNLFPLLAGPMTGWEPHLKRAAAMGFSWAFINCNKGRPNAAVFPVPVCASPTRSLVPLNKTGIAFSCMGVGSVNPNALIALRSFSSNPNPSNVTISL